MNRSDRDMFCAIMAGYLEEIVPGSGIDPDIVVDRALTDPTRENLLITLNSERVGFAMIRPIGTVLRELTEFAIRPEERRKGVGLTAVHRILRFRPGAWQIGVVDTKRAVDFWDRALASCPGLCDLRTEPPLTKYQRYSYRFTI